MLPIIEEETGQEIKFWKSKLDKSVNHVYEDGSEFRFVEREDRYTIYLSSHTGCSLSCKMCHLTETGQTTMLPLKQYLMRDRAHRVADEHCGIYNKPINFAFMARGEPLANDHVDSNLIERLLSMADWIQRGKAVSKATISTIFPTKVVGENIAEFLFERFESFQPHIYWSLYSLDLNFRKEWLPEAQDPEIVARELKKWQDVTMKDVIIHQPLIRHKNDHDFQAEAIVDLMRRNELNFRVNLIRYNTPNEATCGVEAFDQSYQDHYDYYRGVLGNSRVKIQSRVGFDVKASCGMFHNGETA